MQQESCHVMPCIVAHAVNTNDVMCASCDMYALASWSPLGKYDMPKLLIDIPFMPAEWTSTKINHLTFSYPKL